MNKNCINLSKHKLYQYLAERGIDWHTLMTRQLIPDKCYIDCDAKELRIYEKKYQHRDGSVDEKLQTCAFKIQQYRKIAKALGLKKTTYIYELNNWFKQPKYSDVLKYIESIDGCGYYFYG